MSFRSLNASLISAWLDWCINSKLSKIQIVANAEMVICNDPSVFKNNLQNGMVVFNISPTACSTFFMDDRKIETLMTFNGVPQTIVIPIRAIVFLMFPVEKKGVSKLFQLPFKEQFDFVDPDIVIDCLPDEEKVDAEKEEKLRLVKENPGKNVISMVDFRNKKQK